MIVKALGPEYQAKRAFAADAFRKGYWIYNKRTDAWYTPEEFMKSPDTIAFDLRDGNLTIHSPKVEITARMRKIEEAQVALADFIARVNKYYEFKPIRIKR